jgi:hypothetical protein
LGDAEVAKLVGVPQREQLNLRPRLIRRAMIADLLA